MATMEHKVDLLVIGAGMSMMKRGFGLDLPQLNSGVK